MQSRLRRRRRVWSPAAVEVLEGRALLSVSPIDPTFNGGQVVASPTPLTAGTATRLNTAAAMTLQADGKIVVVGTITQPSSSTSTTPVLAVQRFNADGSVDTGFGTNGEADITVPLGSANAILASADVLIQGDGRIVFSAEIANARPNFMGTIFTSSVATVVVRLNQDGSLDSTFGTAGETVINTDAVALLQLTLDANGKIVLGGTASLTTGSTTTAEVALTRLNTDGSVDSGFNGGNLLLIDPMQYGYLINSFDSTLSQLLVTPAGKVAAVYTITPYSTTPSSTLTGQSTYQVVEFNTDGTINTAFGSNGSSRGTGSPSQGVNAALVQADGKIMLAGSILTRLNADGSVDTSFATPSLPYIADSIAEQPDGKYVLGLDSALAVIRYTAAGGTDGSYGPLGIASFAPPAPTGITYTDAYDSFAGLAVTPAGEVVAVGSVTYAIHTIGSIGRSFTQGSQIALARLRASRPVAGDYDGAGKAEFAIELTSQPKSPIFAIRGPGGDSINLFGVNGIGQTIPVSGDFDGDGKTDIAAYIPSQGVFAYRPSSGGADVVMQFGPAGIGASIPAPGDYSGTGRTDFAVYIPAMGAFAVHPSNGTANYLVPFGTPGVGKSIPAPGDYDGDGKTDFAVYLTATGTLAYRRSGGAVNGLLDSLRQFGPSGIGASIPAPGDYDGDGRTDVAVYIPATGSFAIQPSGGRNNYLVSFGVAGPGASIPAPGDYDGDGNTDLAVYIPSQGFYAYRSSAGKGDIVQQFGTAGTGRTVPASSLPYLQTTGSAGAVNAGAVTSATAAAAVYIPLTDDLSQPTPTKKKAGGGWA